MRPRAQAPQAGFGLLAWSNLAAQAAEQIALAAAAIVAVIYLGASEAETGLLQTALTLPYLLFAIPAGVLVDRLARVGLMAGAEAIRTAALLVMLCLVHAGTVSWLALALLGFIAACGTVMFSIAAPSLVGSLVTHERLPTANARIELARTIAFAAGPAIGGGLVGLTGAGTVFGVAAALSAAAALLLCGVPEPPRVREPARRVWQDVREGVAFVARHDLLRPVFATQFIFNTAHFVVLAAFVPYAVRHLGLSAAGVGLTLGFFGAGMIVGALVAPSLMQRLRFGAIVGIGPAAGLAASIVLAMTIWIPSPALACLSFFLLGAGPIIWVISTATLRQVVTPQVLLGRVTSVNVLAYSARPLGAALGAGAGGLYGAEACLLLAVVGFLAQALVVWCSPVVGLDRQPGMSPHLAAPQRL